MRRVGSQKQREILDSVRGLVRVDFCVSKNKNKNKNKIHFGLYIYIKGGVIQNGKDKKRKAFPLTRMNKKKRYKHNLSAFPFSFRIPNTLDLYIIVVIMILTAYLSRLILSLSCHVSLQRGDLHLDSSTQKFLLYSGIQCD